MKQKRPPILIAGDAAVPTGFARVVESVFAPLAEKFEIHQLGTNYHGDPHDLPWKIYPASLGGGVWGTHRLESLIEKVKPRLLFIINDIWIADDYLKTLAKLENRPPVVLYCPIDSAPIEREALFPLDGIEQFVAYTEFGRREIEKAVAAARQDRPEFRFPEIDVIPHGIDTEVFHPFDGENPRLKARRKLFPDREDFHDAFIVLNANRNQPRKRIDVTMEGFARFAAGKPENVKLYLHMGVEDQGWNIFQLARRLDIEDRLIVSTHEKNLPPFTTKHLNHVYNACDVGLNTSHGEGWGLVSFEHAATRAAQIVPARGPSEELWKDSALLLEPRIRVINKRILTEGWLIDPDSVADALELLHRDEERREELAVAAYENATRPEYHWDVISKQWERKFNEIAEISASED